MHAIFLSNLDTSHQGKCLCPHKLYVCSLTVLLQRLRRCYSMGSVSLHCKSPVAFNTQDLKGERLNIVIMKCNFRKHMVFLKHPQLLISPCSLTRQRTVRHYLLLTLKCVTFVRPVYLCFQYDSPSKHIH